jgi:hypothetical protein
LAAWEAKLYLIAPQTSHFTVGRSDRQGNDVSRLQQLSAMSDKLNKKQKKQIDIARKKLTKLHQLLGAARKQPDDPADVPRLEAEIAQVQQEIDKIQAGG